MKKLFALFALASLPSFAAAPTPRFQMCEFYFYVNIPIGSAWLTDGSRLFTRIRPEEEVATTPLSCSLSDLKTCDLTVTSHFPAFEEAYIGESHFVNGTWQIVMKDKNQRVIGRQAVRYTDTKPINLVVSLPYNARVTLPPDAEEFTGYKEGDLFKIQLECTLFFLKQNPDLN